MFLEERSNMQFFLPACTMLNGHKWEIRTVTVHLVLFFLVCQCLVGLRTVSSAWITSFPKSGSQEAWGIEMAATEVLSCLLSLDLPQGFRLSQHLSLTWFGYHNMETELPSCLPTPRSQVVKVNVYKGLCLLWLEELNKCKVTVKWYIAPVS